MRSKKPFYILCALNFFLLCLIFTNTGNAFNFDEQVITIFSSKDSHIFNGAQDTNYGDWEDMHCGNYIPEASFALRKNWAYIYFDISSSLKGWEKVSLLLTVWNIAKSSSLEMGIVNDYWNESTITWLNRPSNITWGIECLNLETDGKIILDITDLIFPFSSSFSIILYNNQTTDNINILINTKEYPIQDNHPQLVFEYPNNSIRPTPRFSIVSITIVCTFIIGLAYFIVIFLERQTSREEITNRK